MRTPPGSKSNEEILKGYLWALDKMRPTLRALFRAAIKSQKDLDGLQFRPQRKPNLLQVMEWAATIERAQEIYAGSMFLVLDQWIKALGRGLGIQRHNRSFGEKIGSSPLAELIWATANNFRHFEEWSDPNESAMRNIRVLDGAGIHNVRDFNVSPYVLRALEVSKYQQLEAKLCDIGKDMLAQAPKH